MMQSFHMGQSVRGFLHKSDREIKKLLDCFRHDDGRPFVSVLELRTEFEDELAKGHEVLPLGKCDNWDWKDGCKGHPAERSDSEEGG